MVYTRMTYNYKTFESEDELTNYLNNNLDITDQIISIYSRDNKIVLIYSEVCYFNPNY